MRDKVFEWSISALSVCAVFWMIFGSIFNVMDIVWVVITGIVVWMVGSGTMLYFWGKNYMSRV